MCTRALIGVFVLFCFIPSATRGDVSDAHPAYQLPRLSVLSLLTRLEIRPNTRITPIGDSRTPYEFYSERPVADSSRGCFLSHDPEPDEAVLHVGIQLEVVVVSRRWHEYHEWVEYVLRTPSQGLMLRVLCHTPNHGIRQMPTIGHIRQLFRITAPPPRVID